MQNQHWQPRTKKAGPMERKSTHTPEYDVFVELLRETREKAGISQEKLAGLIGRDQSIVSRWETGELRLDIVQLRDVCNAVGTTLPRFMEAYEERLKKKPHDRGPTRASKKRR